MNEGHNRFLPHPLELSKGKDIQTRVDINGIKKKKRKETAVSETYRCACSRFAGEILREGEKTAG
jgi:hypothetical protein